MLLFVPVFGVRLHIDGRGAVLVVYYTRGAGGLGNVGWFFARHGEKGYEELRTKRT